MLWRILSKTGLIYCAGAFEAFSATIFAFILVTFYGEAIPTGELPTEGDHHFYLRSNGIHTELILPTESKEIDWKETIEPKDFGENMSFDYIVFGWGDKGFFMNTPEWSDLTATTATSAILVPTSTAMHVGYEPKPIESNDCVRVSVSEEQYRIIIRYVQNSFLRKRNRVQLIPNKGYGHNDNFYEAKNSYHAFRTCNTWTSNALKEAGIRTSALAVFPNSVMGHFRK